MGRRNARPAFSQVADQLQSLTLAAGKRVDRLAEPQITKPDFLQQFQLFRGALGGTRVGEPGEEFNNFIHCGIEQIGDGPGLVRCQWSVVSCFPAMRLLTTDL